MPQFFPPRVRSSAVGDAVGWGEVACQIRLTRQYNNNEAQSLMSSRHPEHGRRISALGLGFFFISHL